MKRLVTALLALVAVVGMAHAGASKDQVLRKAEQHAAMLAAQTAVSLRDVSSGPLQPFQVNAGGVACDASVPGIVIHDDGEAEDGYGWNAAANIGRYAERFTPAVYPAKVTTVCTALISNTGVTDLNVTIAVYDDDGVDGAPGTLLGEMAFVSHPDALTGVPTTPAFESFDLSSLGINIASGDVYFSVEWDAAVEPAGVFIAADLSPTTTKQVGYSSSDGAAWVKLGQAGDPTNADYRALFIRPAMPVAGPGAPGLGKSFAPALIMAGETSTLTITLNNVSQPTAAVLGSDLVDNLPAGVLIAATPNASTTCINGTVTAAANTGAVILAAGAEIPAEGSCTVSVDVTSATDGSYENIIPAGALQTQHGSNSGDATAVLQVGYIFPQPYCEANFPSAVEPISRVAFADIDNASSPVVNGSPALENFTSVIGHVDPGASLQMALEGNTNGNFTSVFKVYIDWNQNQLFDADEAYLIGDISNSDGLDGQQAVSTIEVPLDALPGDTRMRVTKRFLNAAPACNTSGYGQAEDYTLEVAALDTSPRVTKAFAPAMVMASVPSTLTLTLSNKLNSGDATLTSAFTDNFPAGLVVAPTPNAATTCASGTVTTAAGADAVTLEAGAIIPGGGTCTVTVDVSAAADDVYTNTIPAGALQTDLGNSPLAASAELQVGYIFPQPYCEVDFTNAIEPISLVDFAGIHNTSDPTVGGSPALENFTGITGHVRAGKSASMAVEGNTNGGFPSVIKVYIDWNQNHTFDSGEGYVVGSFTGSDGTDGQQAVGDIQIPADALAGTTRMRVTKSYSSPASACGANGWGQAEDYTLDVAPAVPEVSKSFSPSTIRVAETSVATITVSNPTASDATLTAALVDTFPAGLNVSNIATNCGLVIGAAAEPSALAGSNEAGLPAGMVLPAGSSCDITATVQAATAGSYVNLIPAGALQTDQGNSPVDAEATLTVLDSPYVTAAFTPATVQRTEDSTAVITLVNPGATAAVLTAPLVDNLPAGLVATSATTTCLGASNLTRDATGNSGLAGSSVSLPAGASIPANGSCALEITVHSDSLGTFVNEIPEGALQTDQGSNYGTASATLTVEVLPSDPVIAVTPDDLTAAQPSNTVTTQMITIGNTGGSELAWSTFETAIVSESAPSAGYGVASGTTAVQGALDLRSVWAGSMPSFAVNAGAAGSCASTVPGIVIHDDGELENGAGWNPTAGMGRIADPFTPGSYPATISTVCFAFITNTGVTSFNFDVVVYAADGAGGAPGTELGRKSFVGHPAAVAGLPATASYEAFDITSLGLNITSGSVYISAEWDAAVEPEGIFLAFDESTSTPLQEGYTGANGEPWAPTVDSNPTYRAMFIRTVFPSASCDATDLPWLSVSPSSGSTAQGGSSSVAVSFDSTNLATGTYTGMVCIASNDPVTPVVMVPVSLTVDAAEPVATVTPAALDFAVAADATASDTLDIANASGSDPLTFSIMARGANNLSFRLQPTDGQRKRAVAKFAANPPSLMVSPVTAAPSVQDAPWLPSQSVRANGTPLVFMLDDGSAETAIGWGAQGPPPTESMGVFLNRFAPPAGTAAYTITNVSILWPDASMSGAPMTGLQANLVFYYDFDSDGDPSNAFRLGPDQLVTIASQGEFENYPVSVSVPGDGDVYVGFADYWARLGGYTPRIFPAALDETASMGMSYLSADSADITDLDNLGNNDTTGTLDALGAPGNWMIRAVGTTGSTCVGPAVSWVSVAPASGSVNGGDSSQVTVTVDPSAAGLGAGVYQADLCITTNDPAQARIVIPLTMTVTPPDGIFCDGFEAGGDGSCAAATPTPASWSDVVTSGTLDIEIPATFDGVYINWLSGATCRGDNSCGGQLNLYTDAAGGLSLLWPNRAAGTGGVATAAGSGYAILQPGTVVGPNSSLLRTAAADFNNWRAGVDGYLGFAFDCSALGASRSGICYGYVHLVTSPAGVSRLVEYGYDPSGASVTIK